MANLQFRVELFFKQLQILSKLNSGIFNTSIRLDLVRTVFIENQLVYSETKFSVLSR